MSRTRSSRVIGLGLVASVAFAMAVAVPASAVVGAADEAEHGFVARVDMGNGTRACSGAVVAPEWLLTAASCFVADPAAGVEVPPGLPEGPVTATIGRADLTTEAGQVLDVVELVPHPDRDLVLARLGGSASVDPVELGRTVPSVAENLVVSGFGRTATEWAPLRRHAGGFAVDSVSGGDVAMTGVDGAAVCAGDTGGPVLRPVASGVELVAVASRSWQGGCFGSGDETRTGAIGTRVDDVRGWIDGIVWREGWADFNCDGMRDLAIGDPNARVNGRDQAGKVRVVYGGGQGNAVVTQDSPTVTDRAEVGDRFGVSLAVYDRNQDGCTDLAVGAPSETVDGDAGAGLVNVIHGSPEGLRNGPSGVTYRPGLGSGALRDATRQPRDHLGYAVAAGHSAAGVPYLAVGVPGKAVDGAGDAGLVYYVPGGDPSIAIEQADVGGASEAGDEFGYAIAADGRYLAVGVPGKTRVLVLPHPVGDVAAAGPVRTTLLVPPGATGATAEQGSRQADEPGDLGLSVDTTTYLPDGESARRSLVAVGIPGEDVDSIADAGRVVTYSVGADGARQLGEYHQGVEGVDGEPEQDDQFGADVAVENLAAGTAATPTSVLLAAGVQNDGTATVDGTVVRSGSVSVFSALGTPADLSARLYPGAVLPGEPEDVNLGETVHGTGSGLYLGIPGASNGYGIAYVVPWPRILGDAPDEPDEPVLTYRPEMYGSTEDHVSFGASLG